MPIIIIGPVAPPTEPTEATSAEGVLHAWADAAYGGIKLRTDWSVLSGVTPDHVVFLRGDDSPVRGGDPAQAVSKLAYAYDHEAKIGAPTTYYAIAYDASDVEISRTGLVSLRIPEATGLVDLWLKSIDDPSLSMLLSMRVDAPEIGSAGRLGFVQPQGSSYPGGAFDVRTIQPIEVIVRLSTIAERKQFDKLIGSGHLFVQMRQAYGEDDFYAVAGDSSRRVFITMTDPRRDATVSLVPISRPATLDAPAVVPGYSIADVAATAPTISQVVDHWPTIAAMAGFDA